MRISSRFIIHSIQNSLRKRNLEVQGRVQQFIDSEVIRLSEPYTPFDNGFLKNDAPILGTTIGTGKIKYVGPYAKRQYYTNAGRSGGNRGKLWFERMKVDHLDDIIHSAANISGARADI